MATQPAPLVGLVPAAGRARRLGRLACSKEIHPISSGDSQRRVACDWLLWALHAAAVPTAYVVLGDGKWDIPAFLGDGSAVGVRLAYLTVQDSPGTPSTLAQAVPFLADARVVFGFPDILFEPADAFVALLARQEATGADVVLGCWPADQPEKMDMVERDETGRVRRLVIKPTATDLTLTWIVAVWTPRFTEYLHAFVGERVGRTAGSAERYVGDVVQAAIDDGWVVDTVVFPDGGYRDIGTPEDLAAAVAEGGAGAAPRPTPR